MLNKHGEAGRSLQDSKGPNALNNGFCATTTILHIHLGIHIYSLYVDLSSDIALECTIEQMVMLSIDLHILTEPSYHEASHRGLVYCIDG